VALATEGETEKPDLAMAPSCAHFPAAALALLLLCSVSLSAADRLPQRRNSTGSQAAATLERVNMSDPASALAAVRQYLASLDATLAQAVGAHALEAAEEAEQAVGSDSRRRLAAIPSACPSTAPRVGARASQ